MDFNHYEPSEAAAWRLFLLGRPLPAIVARTNSSNPILANSRGDGRAGSIFVAMTLGTQRLKLRRLPALAQFGTKPPFATATLPGKSLTSWAIFGKAAWLGALLRRCYPGFLV